MEEDWRRETRKHQQYVSSEWKRDDVSGENIFLHAELRPPRHARLIAAPTFSHPLGDKTWGVASASR